MTRGAFKGQLSLCFVLMLWCWPVQAKSERVPVSLQLKWHHQFQFAGYYAALEKGFYEEAGLAVTLREATTNTDIVQTVIEGHADFGVGTSELMISYAKGLPVLMVAPIFQHSPLMMLVRADAGIESVHDLPGKQVMIEPQSAQLLAYFLSEGLQLDTLQYRPHNFEMVDLLAGRIDGLSAYSTDEPFLMAEAKIPYRMFTPRANGMDFYGDTLFTSQGYFKQFPDRVKAFRDASLRGWEYALENPEEMIHLIQAKYSQRQSLAHLRYEAKHTYDMIRPDFVELGYSNPGRWRSIQEVYQKYKLMPNPLSLQGFFYTETPPALRLPPWAYVVLISSVLLSSALSLCLLLFAFFNRKLRQEIQERERIQKDLLASRRDLTQANMAKRNFLAHMSHEIRTPMNGLVSMLVLLKASTLSERDQHYVEIAHHSAGLLLNLVGDILDFSRIEAGKLELDVQPFALHAQVSAVLNTLAIPAHQKGLALHAFLPVPPPAELLGDAARLQQVLFNLLGNAIKFTEAGHVRLVIAMDALTDVDCTLTFQVFDTGIGIDAETLKDLFQPFQQQDVSIGRRFGGSGLGLSISQQLVHLMGGQLWGTSQPQGGSCFSFHLTFPVVKAEPTDWPHLHSQRVALCGFSALERDSLAHILRQSHATVFFFETPQAFEASDEAFDQLVMPADWLEVIAPTQDCVVVVPLGNDEKYAACANQPHVSVCTYPVVGHELLRCFSERAVSPASPQTELEHTYSGVILLVEDNPINQVVTRAILDKMPGALRLLVANHGEEALALLTQHPEVDLVLMDLHMPVLNGFETLVHIRQSPRWSQLPVVAVTAQALDGDRESCLKAGFNDYLNKPFLPAQLEAVVKQYLI